MKGVYLYKPLGKRGREQRLGYRVHFWQIDSELNYSSYLGWGDLIEPGDGDHDRKLALILDRLLALKSKRPGWVIDWEDAIKRLDDYCCLPWLSNIKKSRVPI